MVERPPTGSIPDGPGSYQFKDEDGRVIYVGKASSLRSRLSNYFQKHLPPRTAQMVATAESVEWIQVANDVEALMLEFNLIKQHRPRFNVRLVDDKSYPFLAVTVGDDWPRPMVMRGAKRKGVRYYGPFAHAYAIRETLDLLLRTFPLRTCSDNKFNLHQKQGRPCLLFHIEKCSGPCVGEIDREAYQQLTDELLAFLDGETDAIVKRLEREMQTAASELEFERAARLRDQLGSVRKAIERQQMVAERVLQELGLDEEIPCASLAKRFEEIYVPGLADPIRLPRQSEALYMLQRIRDEAHRFAITFHRELRGKRMTTSVLDEVPGLGPVRRKRLIKELGGVTAVKRAELDQLQSLAWLPDTVAQAVYDKVHKPAGRART